jgi:hypothetical protein
MGTKLVQYRRQDHEGAWLTLTPSHSVLTLIDPQIDATDAQLMRRVGLYRTITCFQMLNTA